MIPNIQRNKIKKQIALEEKRYVETAKHAMNYTVKHLAKMVNKKKWFYVINNLRKNS